MFSSEGPFLEGCIQCRLLDGATYTQAVMHWEVPHLGHNVPLVHHLGLFMSKFLNLPFKVLALKVCRFLHVGCLLIQSIHLFHVCTHLHIGSLQIRTYLLKSLVQLTCT